MSIEKRNLPRNKVFRVGRMFVEDASAGIDCLVRNVTLQGALIEVESSVAIPDRFDLVLVSDGKVHACTVRRRSETTLGVAFAA